MSTFDDPNREAVGLEPIWTGAGEVPEGRQATPAAPTGVAAGFDPGAHTVADVEAYLAEHPDETDAVLAAEAQGKNRASLTGG